MRGTGAIYWLIILLVIGVARLCPAGSGDEGAFFSPDGSLIILSQAEVAFHVDGPPGLYDAEAPVEVFVRSISGEWAISCHAEPLLGENGEIAPDRIFIKHEYTDPNADFGGGPGYESLGEPRLIAEGAFTGPGPLEANSLSFRILTTWKDEPGTYRGLIRFTYLLKP